MSLTQQCQVAEGGWGRAAVLCQPGPDVRGKALPSSPASPHALAVMYSHNLCSSPTLLTAPNVPSWVSPPALCEGCSFHPEGLASLSLLACLPHTHQDQSRYNLLWGTSPDVPLPKTGLDASISPPTAPLFSLPQHLTRWVPVILTQVDCVCIIFKSRLK